MEPGIIAISGHDILVHTTLIRIPVIGTGIPIIMIQGIAIPDSAEAPISEDRLVT
jgi:hypothetical protein